MMCALSTTSAQLVCDHLSVLTLAAAALTLSDTKEGFYAVNEKFQRVDNHATAVASVGKIAIYHYVLKSKAVRLLKRDSRLCPIAMHPPATKLQLQYCVRRT